nr:MAG TPA: hypothetical protein [Caudoviricetes sp.]
MKFSPIFICILNYFLYLCKRVFNSFCNSVAKIQ